jgi:AmmeMemoRadiSam system protein B
MFYPADPPSVQGVLEQWFGRADVPRDVWRAALVPHAGWVYSGRIAAAVFQRIIMPRTVIVLCPKHRAGGAECAVAPWRQWQFPGGSMATNVELSERLAGEVPLLQLDERPHHDEHAIEVQLPLLARCGPDSQLVGITVGRVGWEDCQAIAGGLAAMLRGQLDDVLLVISSDMNHFGSDVENRRQDDRALQALDQRDPEELYRTCHRHRITMCGMLPAVIVLSTLRLLGELQRAQRVAYTTSAEVSGDTDRVVGYAGMLFG